MSVTREHRRPLLAFVLVSLLCSLVVGNSMTLASGSDDGFLAEVRAVVAGGAAKSGSSAESETSAKGSDDTSSYSSDPGGQNPYGSSPSDIPYYAAGAREISGSAVANPDSSPSGQGEAQPDDSGTPSGSPGPSAAPSASSTPSTSADPTPTDPSSTISPDPSASPSVDSSGTPDPSPDPGLSVDDIAPPADPSSNSQSAFKPSADLAQGEAGGSDSDAPAGVRFDSATAQ
jgi:hypothetical protein